MKKIVALFLVIVTMMSLIPVSLAAGPANVNGIAVDHALSLSQFAMGKYKKSGPCWSFVNDLAKEVYGVGIGSIGDNKYTLNNGANWTLVAQKSGVQSQNSIAAILKQAQPGDVVQYKNSFTKPQHTLIIEKVTSSSVIIYEALSSTGIQRRELKFSSLDGSLGKFDAAVHGISIYRCKKKPAYNYEWSEKIINKSARIINVDTAYGLEPTPTQNKTKLEWINPNSKVTVIASYINADGDTWMKVRTNSGKTGFVYQSYLKY